jgi:hypothetical protein
VKVYMITWREGDDYLVIHSLWRSRAAAEQELVRCDTPHGNPYQIEEWEVHS